MIMTRYLIIKIYILEIYLNSKIFKIV